MVKLLGLPETVDAPPATPPLHGLRDSARFIPEVSDRWEMGVRLQPETCATVKAWSSFCAPDREDFDDPDGPSEPLELKSFVLYRGLECDAQSLIASDLEARARRQLEAGTSKGMEAQFWSDDLGLDDWSLVKSTPNSQGGVDGTIGILNADAATAPVAVSPRLALARLGRALGSCGLGGRGMLHVTADVAEFWVGNGHVEAEGQRLVTKTRGDIVVVGSGYPGTGPAGNPSATPLADQSWVYATGMIEYRMTDPRTEGSLPAEVVYRPQNLADFYVQRTVQLSLDGCCVFAVLVDLSDSTLGGEEAGPRPASIDGGGA
jgi:hypothetical protein